MKLIVLGGLWGKSVSWGDPWEIGIQDDIEELVKLGNPREYLTKRLEKEDEKQKENEKRYSRKPNYSQLLPWVSYNINIWLISYVFYLNFPKIFRVSITMSIWFILYTVCKVSEDVFQKRIPFFSGKKVMERILWWGVSIFISAGVGKITGFYYGNR